MSIEELLDNTAHRPWPLPEKSWLWYQEWNNLVFIHARVDLNWLRKLVPDKLNIDTFYGDAWISFVVFRMQKIRPRFFTSLKFLSDFTEINIRTYVTINNMPGVYFLSIEADKLLSCVLARTISGLPYKLVPFTFDDALLNAPFLSFEYNVGDKLENKTGLDLWLTERYCLYCNKNNDIYRYNIHHIPWPLFKIDIKNLELNYPKLKTMKHIIIPELFQFSPGVRVLAWSKEKVV